MAWIEFNSVYGVCDSCGEPLKHVSAIRVDNNGRQGAYCKVCYTKFFSKMNIRNGTIPKDW